MDADSRVFAAADELFEASGRLKFPSVYDVRKLAGVGMPATNRAMQAWRTNKLLSVATPIEVDIPASLNDAGKNALGQLWAAANDISRQSLVTAQRAFDEHIARGKAAEDDMAAAFETQGAELEALRAEYENFRSSHGAAMEDSARELAIARDCVAGFREICARLEESQKQILDMKATLEREQDSIKRIWNDSWDRAKRDELRICEAQDREKSALEAVVRYRDQCESLKAKNAELLHKVKTTKAVRRRKSAE